tara:strand:- start:2024 stop:2461 length:438 start_codon:yes stop_codon:yes gene_type:complete
MKKNKKIPITNFSYSSSSLLIKKFSCILLFFLELVLLPTQPAKSGEIFLECTGKYEINRGELIKPDWETSYITINLDGLSSYIVDKGIKKEGKTLIRSSSYTITQRDKRNKIKTRYKIHRIHSIYRVDQPQRNRTLIGTCQKGRG